jgi:phosphopantetheinyl transferase (holo-ACP synthase)
VASKPVEPAKKVIAQKKYKAMVKVSQDAEYMPTTLAESEAQIKDLIAQTSENLSFTIVEKLVNDGKNVIENFLPEYNKQTQQLKVKIGEREYAYHDIDLSELSVLTLEQWFDLNN